jgi:hypothetical protein
MATYQPFSNWRKECGETQKKIQTQATKKTVNNVYSYITKQFPNKSDNSPQNKVVT